MRPRLCIDLKKFHHNGEKLCEMAAKAGLDQLAFVTKSFCALPEMVKALEDLPNPYLADSRIENLAAYPPTKKEKILLRLPMLSQCEKVVKYADISFCSEGETLAALNTAAKAAGKNIIYCTDVHPKDKAPVGERLARLALNQTYGMQHVAQHGPTPARAFCFRGKTVIIFKNATMLNTSDGKPLRGIEIAGKIGGFTAVDFEKQARIEGNRIIIEGEAHRIRYAWEPFTDANLVNEEGLPASTFGIEADSRPPRRPGKRHNR